MDAPQCFEVRVVYGPDGPDDLVWWSPEEQDHNREYISYGNNLVLWSPAHILSDYKYIKTLCDDSRNILCDDFAIIKTCDSVRVYLEDWRDVHQTQLDSDQWRNKISRIVRQIEDTFLPRNGDKPLAFDIVPYACWKYEDDPWKQVEMVASAFGQHASWSKQGCPYNALSFRESSLCFDSEKHEFDPLDSNNPVHQAVLQAVALMKGFFPDMPTVLFPNRQNFYGTIYDPWMFFCKELATQLKATKMILGASHLSAIVMILRRNNIDDWRKEKMFEDVVKAMCDVPTIRAVHLSRARHYDDMCRCDDAIFAFVKAWAKIKQHTELHIDYKIDPYGKEEDLFSSLLVPYSAAELVEFMETLFSQAAGSNQISIHFAIIDGLPRKHFRKFLAMYLKLANLDFGQQERFKITIGDKAPAWYVDKFNAAVEYLKIAHGTPGFFETVRFHIDVATNDLYDDDAIAEFGEDAFRKRDRYYCQPSINSTPPSTINSTPPSNVPPEDCFWNELDSFIL